MKNVMILYLSSFSALFLARLFFCSSCYLALGEVADASRYFQKLLQSTDVGVEHKLLQEAADGVQKAQVLLLSLYVLFTACCKPTVVFSPLSLPGPGSK